MKSIIEEVRVRWRETDTAGVVHFSNYFVYFEAAEQKLFREILKMGFSRNAERGKVFSLPRVEAYCQYLSPAKFDDLLEVELKIGSVGRTSITYEFSVRNKTSGKLSASGRVKVVAVDERSQPVEISSEILELLK